MTLDEALHATIMGDKVTHDGLGRDTFVDYNFNGFEHKTMKRFGVWASCTFIASEADEAADWRVIEWEEPKPLPSVWGKITAAIDASPAQEPLKPATGLAGFLAVQAAPEPSPVPRRDAWGRPID